MQTKCSPMSNSSRAAESSARIAFAIVLAQWPHVMSGTRKVITMASPFSV
jgi:hypothetical protein